MGRDGRQRMLKMKPLRHNKKGQALIEFLPVILLFIVIMSVSFIFFMGLRESAIMQEAARNAAFAKIANSGPLVSREFRSGASNYYEFPLEGAQNIEIDNSKTCFSTNPQLSTNGNNIFKLPSILGVEMDLQRTHKMTVFRRPGSEDYCD